MMAALQDHERALEPTRRPGHTMAEPHVDWLIAVAREAEGRVLVAEEGGPGSRPLGFLVCWVERAGGFHVEPSHDHYGMLTDCFVVPDARGRGVSRALIAVAEAHFRALGLSWVIVHHLARNQGASEAYDAMGYAPLEIARAKRL
ncbi:MAG: GNAT family N-acetyltransferase [Rhodospirillum sp.]|nr:GNAT family N-acetyltransferase [Rhodospirillum sp.]MCF8492111.1 GNAT family N-acetyltransferase [Rhodospirillum sp.]